ncbi:Vta1, C-terminal [Dillenia turbinata]|uniref:Vta1, C-terminal n=1 Tax=Dillenia turbinata TaxID=194707 RepID=A0AAN8VGA3_9MAGN
MTSENEPAKLLLPYLQRADELQKHEPLVAYYCRLYAIDGGLKIPQSDRTKTTNALLLSLMNQLEKDKKSLNLGPDDNLHLEGFALNVFAKADKQDRAGRADWNTAKTFYAASIFFEILNQFGELQPDLEQKQKYAAWKAADISKALKEGRKPVPGPPGGDEDLSVLSTTQKGVYDVEPSNMDPSVLPEPKPDLVPKMDLKGSDTQSGDFLPSPSAYPTNEYPSHVYHPPPETNKAGDPTYSQSYPKQFYQQEPQLHHTKNFSAQETNHESDSPDPRGYLAQDHSPQETYHQQLREGDPYFQESPQHPQQNYCFQEVYHQQIYKQEQSHQPTQQYSSQETLPYSYPNFQSYPSFAESSFPAVPTHSPSPYQGPDASFSTQSAPPVSSHPSIAQFSSINGNGIVSEPPSQPKTYKYDSNYQPPPENVSEAHKAARFAVGALAFDDVSVAIDFLRKSLELLTNHSSVEAGAPVFRTILTVKD